MVRSSRREDQDRAFSAGDDIYGSTRNYGIGRFLFPSDGLARTDRLQRTADGEAAAAARALQSALDQFKDARPSELDRIFEQANKGKVKGQKAAGNVKRKDKK